MHRLKGRTDVHFPQAKRHLLLVDDEPINREIIVDLLADSEFAIDQAANGEQAVRQALTKQYEVIVMDISMPFMDGFAASKAIRQIAGYRRTPIMALTANDTDEIRTRCLGAGIDIFMAKPFSPETFLIVLKSCLKRPDTPVS